MKKYCFTILISIACTLASSFHAKADSFFQLPIVPDTMAFNNRIDYLVTHYWDFCDLKKAFSAKQKMITAFQEYLDLMPMASRDAALASIEKFIKSIESKPDNILTITSAAEDYIHSDTAQYYSDEIYLPFAKAVATNKKISSAQKARYEHQYKILSNSMVGSQFPDIQFVNRDNQTQSLYADSAKIVLIYFFEQDCSDCSLTKIRLDADINTTKLIDAGTLKIIAISPTTPDGEFFERVKSYPEKWTVGASPMIDETIDIRSVPSFYVLDDTHKIYGKNLNLDQVLLINQQLAGSVRDPYVKKHWEEQRKLQEAENQNNN